jgi:glycosyltransferase involved in cell wall biosynthesis
MIKPDRCILSAAILYSVIGVWFMKIGFDIRPLQYSSHYAGVGIYVKNLLESLSAIDRENEFFLLTVKGAAFPNVNLHEDFRYSLVPVAGMKPAYLNVFLDKFTLPGILESFTLDLLHVLNPFELKSNFDLGRYNHKLLITVLDLIPLFFRDKIFVKRRKLLAPLFDLMLKNLGKAARFVSISQSTKNDLVKYLNIPEEKIVVTLLGRDENFRPMEDKALLETIRKKFNLPAEFILYVGGFSHRKNLDNLFRALKNISERFGVGIPLVIAGGLDRFFLGEMKIIIAELQIENLVYFTDQVEPEELVVFYNLASVFVFPSLYEGFGLPVLESMSCGTPVACSDRSSLPEVGGNAAVYFNPESVSDMSEKIFSLYTDTGMQDELGKKGLERAKLFTWEKTAVETLEIYKSFL